MAASISTSSTSPPAHTAPSNDAPLRALRPSRPGASLSFRDPRSRLDGTMGVLLGLAFSVGVFFFVALTQMLGDVEPPRSAIEETLISMNVPDIEEIEIEDLPEPELEEEPPPELDDAPPDLSLDQLDIALNPGTGGALVGEFSLAGMSQVRSLGQNLDTEQFVDFSDLDQIPRPIGVSGLNFPRRLRAKPVDGRIVLMLKIDEKGRVLDVRIDSSDLPRFDSFVLGEVRGWRFTPPTRHGNPVRAKARLPIPIRIS